MKESNTPQGQDSTAKDTKKGKNSGTIGQRAPTSTEAPPTEDEADEAKNHRNSAIGWIKKQVSLTLLIESLGFIVLVRVACIYSGQLEQMIENNHISRESLQSVQRAFVAVSPVPEIQTANTGSDQLMLFNFWMENAGATPTKKLTAHVNWIKSNKGLPLPTDFDFRDVNIDGSQDSTVSVIGPKNRFPLSVGPIPRDFMERLYRREVRLFVYGWVRYNDVFEKTPRHVVKFSYELVAVPGKVRLQTGQEGLGLQTLVNGPRFNCYDEECDEQAHQ